MKDNLELKIITLFRHYGSIRAVAAKLIEDGDVDTQLTQTRKRVKHVLQSSGEHIEVESHADKSHYYIVDDCYFWKINDDRIINIPVTVIDELFFDYSEHGKDLTSVEIMHKYNLEPWQWHSIKTRLNLYKRSNIFSPYTVQGKKGEELEQLIEDKISEKFERKGELVAHVFKRVQRQEYKKVIEKDANYNLIYQQGITDLIENFPIPYSISVTNVYVNTYQHEHLVVPLADLHIGAKTQDLPNTLPYDINIARKYIEECAYYINTHKAKHVSIFILGDIIATLSGLNHINSWRGLQYLMWGNKVIITAFELLEYFFSLVHNIHSVSGVAGNHDRSSSNSELDVVGDVAANIFYMLERIYGKHFDVTFNSDTVYKEIDGIGYIILHGHKPYVSKSKQKGLAGSDIVMRYGNNKIFNVILSGHLHERKIIEDDTMFRWYQCPAIFTGDRYSEDHGFYSLPGFYTMYNNGNGIIETKDYTFK